MKVYYIRHAQSSNNIIQDLSNAEYDKLREQDPSISEAGKLQIQLLIQYLKQKKLTFDEIRCSPQKRAIQTAQFISDQFKIPIKIQQNLHEKGGNQYLNQGFPGLTRQQFQELYNNVDIDPIIQDKGWYFKDYRETTEECQERAIKVVNDLEKEQDNKTIIIIGHGNFMDQILGVICGRDINSKYCYYHQNCGITYFKNDGNGFELDYYNDYTFLQMYYLQTGEDLMIKRIANGRGKL